MIDEVFNKQLKETYCPEGSALRNHQLKVLEIMKVVDKICRGNGINYWLGSGTLLGAVRHGGFIPWDDDIDIEILYRDKNKFVKACERELPSYMHVQSSKSDPAYFNEFIKIRDEREPLHQIITLFGKEYELDEKYKGRFIDVFTEEPAFPFLVKLSNYMFDKNLIIYYAHGSKIGARVHHKVCKLFAFIARMLAIFKSKECLYHTYGSHFNSRRKYSDIFPLREVSFEGYKFKAPGNWDAYLTALFGDYMKLPESKTTDHRF